MSFRIKNRPNETKQIMAMIPLVVLIESAMENFTFLKYLKKLSQDLNLLLNLTKNKIS